MGNDESAWLSGGFVGKRDLGAGVEDHLADGRIQLQPRVARHGELVAGGTEIEGGVHHAQGQ